MSILFKWKEFTILARVRSKTWMSSKEKVIGRMKGKFFNESTLKAEYVIDIYDMITYVNIKSGML